MEPGRARKADVRRPGAMRLAGAVSIVAWMCLAAPSFVAGDVPPSARDERLEVLGAPERLRIEGSRTFAPEDISRALSSVPIWLLATHPCAQVADYTTFLERSVRLGYLASGFPEARAAVRVDRSRGEVVVAVSEGRRCRAGSVLVEGNRAVLSEEVVRLLTEPRPIPGRPAELRDPAPPLWKPGDFADLSPRRLDLVVDAVRERYESEGFLFPRVEASHREDGREEVALVVRVADEGRRARLREVVIDGRATEDRGALERILGLERGRDIPPGLVERVREALDALGRYSKTEVGLTPAPSGDEADLRLRLFTAPFAPALDAPRRDGRPALRNAFDWLGRPEAWGGSLVIRFEGVRSRADSGLAMDLDRFEVALSADGYRLVVRGLRLAGNEVPDVELHVARDRWALVSERLGLVREALDAKPFPIGVVVRLEPADPEAGPSDGQPMRMTLQAGTSTELARREGPLRLRLVAPEVAITYLLEEDKVRLEPRGGMLAALIDLGEGGTPLEIARIDAATGRVDPSLRIERERFRMSVELERRSIRDGMLEAVARARQRGAREAPATRICLATVSSLSGALLASPAERARLGDLVLRRVVSFALRPGGPLEEELGRLGAEPSATPAGGSFSVPWTVEGAGGRSPDDDLGMVVLFSKLAAALPQGSWLQSIAREAGLATLGQGRLAEEELRRIHDASSVGPVGYWAITELLRLLGAVPVSRIFAARALVESGASGLEKEAETLRSSGAFGARVLEELAAAAKALDPDEVERARAAGPPPDEVERGHLRELREIRGSSDRDAAGKLLDLLWRSSIRDRLRLRLDELRKEPGKAEQAGRTRAHGACYDIAREGSVLGIPKPWRTSS